jgi:hypothetical protein
MGLEPTTFKRNLWDGHEGTEADIVSFWRTSRLDPADMRGQSRT